MTARRAVFVLALAAAALLRAEESAFERAQRAYQAKDYSSAKNLYEELAREGKGGVTLSYNLGNAYFRLGKLGLARLWYERALEDAPGDEDALHNRDLVRDGVGDKDQSGDGWRRATPWVWGAAAAANVAFFLLLCVGLFHESEAVWWGRWVGGLLGIVFLSAAFAARQQTAAPLGVVVERAEARTGPSAQEQVGFVAPEGHRVVMLESLGDWIQIGVPSKGLKGWVTKESVAKIKRED